jgi:hypothetical protein
MEMQALGKFWPYHDRLFCDEFILYEDLIRDTKKAEAMAQLIDAIQAHRGVAAPSDHPGRPPLGAEPVRVVLESASSSTGRY